MAIRVIVIEDHPLMRKAILNELAPHSDIQMVGDSCCGSELMTLVREKSPDVVILDLGMKDEAFEPISAVKTLLHTFPAVRLMILTGYNDRVYMQALTKAGALGYILKNDDFSLNLALGVRTIFYGEPFYSPGVLKRLLLEGLSEPLADQEIAVLRLAAQGHSNEAIGDKLNLSEKRVRNLLTRVYAKLDVHENQGVNARVAMINKAEKLGLLLDKKLA
jgi:DNA-binding NarL/FixJ family response regulator